jgi:hypothetical protein
VEVKKKQTETQKKARYRFTWFVTDIEQGWQVMLISNTVPSHCWLQNTKAKTWLI